MNKIYIVAELYTYEDSEECYTIEYLDPECEILAFKDREIAEAYRGKDSVFNHKIIIEIPLITECKFLTNKQ